MKVVVQPAPDAGLKVSVICIMASKLIIYEATALAKIQDYCTPKML